MRMLSAAIVEPELTS